VPVAASGSRSAIEAQSSAIFPQILCSVSSNIAGNVVYSSLMASDIKGYTSTLLLHSFHDYHGSESHRVICAVWRRSASPTTSPARTRRTGSLITRRSVFKFIISQPHQGRVAEIVWRCQSLIHRPKANVTINVGGFSSRDHTHNNKETNKPPTPCTGRWITCPAAADADRIATTVVSTSAATTMLLPWASGPATTKTAVQQQ